MWKIGNRILVNWTIRVFGPSKLYTYWSHITRERQLSFLLNCEANSGLWKNDVPARRLSIRLSASTTWLSCCVKIHCLKTTENHSSNLHILIDVDEFYPWRFSILILTLKLFPFNVKCMFQLRSIVEKDCWQLLFHITM